MNEAEKIDKLGILQKTYQYVFKNEFPQVGQLVMPSNFSWTPETFEPYLLLITRTRSREEAKSVLFNSVINPNNPQILEPYLESASFSQDDAFKILRDIKATDQPAATTIDNIQLEDLEEKANKAAAEKKKSQAVANQKQATFMKSAQENARRQQEEIEKLKRQTKPQTVTPPIQRQPQTQTVEKTTFVVAPENPEVVNKQKTREQAREVFGGQQVVYIKPTTVATAVELNKTEIQFVNTEAQKIAHDPASYVEKLSSQVSYDQLPANIQKSISPSQFDLHKKVAIGHYAQKLSNLSGSLQTIENVDKVQISPALNKSWLVNYFALETKSPKIALVARDLAINRDLNFFIDSKIAGPNLATIFNGTSEKVDFEATTQPEGAIPINPTQIYSFSEKYYDNHEERENDSGYEQDFADLLRKLDWKSFFKDFSWQKSATGVSNLFSSAFETPALLPAGAGATGAFAGYQLTSAALFSSWEAYGLLQAGGAGGQFAGLLEAGTMGADVIAFEGGKIAAGNFVEGQVVAESTQILATGSKAAQVILEGESLIVGETIATASGTALTTTSAAAIEVTTTGGGAIAAGAGLGSAVPIIGTAIGAAVGLAVSWVSSKLPGLKKWLQENPLVGIILGGGGIFITMGAGSIGGVLMGGTMTLTGGLFTAMSGVNVGSTLSSLPQGLMNALRFAISTSLSEMGKPLLITFLTLPVVVGLIMLIINTGAYIVPAGPPVDGTTGTGTAANGSCPVPNGIVTCGSLGSGSTAATTKCEHGTLSYWNGVVSGGGKMCQWGLPSSDGSHGPNRCGTSPMNNTPCYNSSSQCKNSDGTVVYGFAADVRYPNQGACNASLQVYFPSLNGQTLHWKKFLSFDNVEANGANGVYMAEDGTNVYEMYVTHLAAVATEGDSGQAIGSMSCGLDFPHVHIELRINGDFIRPDTLCTGSSSTNVGGACNASGPYEEGTEPTDLTTLSRTFSARDDTQISSSIETRLTEFIKYARSQGYDLYVYLGYRTYGEQLSLCVDCNNKKQSNPNYPCLAAPASQSKHRTGHAVDMYIGSSLGSVTNMLNDPEIKAKMQELGVSHPISSDPPHFEL